MNFHSILFERPEDRPPYSASEAPDFFGDLALDQIVDAVTAPKQDYDLKPFFYSPLRSEAAIRYRQEVAQDLENERLLKSIHTFAQNMGDVRRYLALVEKLYYTCHKEGWFLEAAAAYCEAIHSLAHDLAQVELKSRGLSAFREYLSAYAVSERFTALEAQTLKLKADLASVRYCILIKGDLVRVRKYEDEPDYSAEVEAAFAKFKQGAVKDYRAKFGDSSSMNHIEAQILDLVARLYPEIFAELDAFCARNSAFLDETIQAFDREIQFYVAYLEHIARIKRSGLKFCYPRIAMTSKEVYDDEGFDLALAHKLVVEGTPIVTNDFYLKGKERIIIVSGPNQGGKTTFARTFGQLHYLASLGLPVPGRQAQLYLYDRLFTHFEREEDIRTLRGKLQDDLVRIYTILEQATPDSIVILNEIFTATTLKDAVFLSNKIMERIDQLDLLCVFVTFIDELASFSEKTVSMVSTIVPDNPALRTYKIVRQPADGLAYALSIAEKHRLTYAQLKERIAS